MVYVFFDFVMCGWVLFSIDSYLLLIFLGDIMCLIGVGIVEESRFDVYWIGDWVSGMIGWIIYFDVEFG